MADDGRLLSMHSVCVQYGRFVAVDGLSLELHGGHLLGLIGPNGAGKTTTLRAAAGLQAISAGRIEIMGHDVFTQPTIVGRHLGLTPDTPAVYDNLTVAQFLDFIGQCFGLPPDTRAERLDHWLEQLWLKDKHAAKVGSLSRGMKQRLAVARTLIGDPKVILMDEPAAGLDPAGRVQFRKLLASLRDQGRALIVSSHILADLADYCTHVAIMERGRVLRYGTVAEVSGNAHQDRCLYRVKLAVALGDAATRIEHVPDLARLQVDGDTIVFEYDRDRSAAAELLKRLLSVGLPIAEFSPMQPDLEEAYLRSGIRQVD